MISSLRFVPGQLSFPSESAPTRFLFWYCLSEENQESLQVEQSSSSCSLPLAPENVIPTGASPHAAALAGYPLSHPTVLPSIPTLRLQKRAVIHLILPKRWSYPFPGPPPELCPWLKYSRKSEQDLLLPTYTLDGAQLLRPGDRARTVPDRHADGAHVQSNPDTKEQVFPPLPFTHKSSPALTDEACPCQSWTTS